MTTTKHGCALGGRLLAAGARSCYRRGMHRLLCLVIIIATACNNDRPKFCDGDTPEKSLPLFEPCNQSAFYNQCAVGECISGFCNEPCQEDDDCTRPDGFLGEMYCSSGINERVCKYICENDYQCPELGGYTTVCVQSSGLFCEHDNLCEGS